MKFHWSDRRLADTVKDGQRVKRFVSHLFDENGTLRGYVKNTAHETWEGYVGKPGRLTGRLIGFFNNRTAAKRAVITEVKLS